MNWTGQRLRRNSSTKCSMKNGKISHFVKAKYNIRKQAKRASPLSWESLDLCTVHKDSNSNPDKLTNLELESSSKPLASFCTELSNVSEKDGILQSIERNKILEKLNAGQHHTMSSMKKIKTYAPQSVSSNESNVYKKQEEIPTKKQRIIKQEDWVGIKPLKSKSSNHSISNSMKEHGTLKSNLQFKSITYQRDEKQIKLPITKNICAQSKGLSSKSDIASIRNQDTKPNISNAKSDKNESIIQTTTCETSRSIALKSKSHDIKTSARDDLAHHEERDDNENQKELVIHHSSSKNKMEMAVKTRIKDPNNSQGPDPQTVYPSDFKDENCSVSLYKIAQLGQACISFSSASLRHPIPRSSRIFYLLNSNTPKKTETLGAPRKFLDSNLHHSLKYHEDTLISDNLSNETLFARDIERAMTSSRRKSDEKLAFKGSLYEENIKLSRAKMRSKHAEVGHEFGIEPDIKERLLSVTPSVKALSPIFPFDIPKQQLSRESMEKPKIIGQQLVVPQKNSTDSCFSKARDSEIWRSFVFGDDEK
ncbi:BgTH12-03692 [Blumeria graminis f. sp. triticale]|uniref:BgTH12-03692 n=1 Tax=Blumeria graminis f. sp. triticale TaxID=1689686 RepID=A0A9W4GCD8_BLUGR|nr:BgTH12-03692 [Blumeria graminis f. sp. triticale]